MARSLTITDGQLAASAGTILSGADAPPTGRADVICHNTGSSEETVVLTFQRAGGTARRLARAILQENESLVVRGVAIQPDDTLLGVTTTASIVDYLVSTSGSAFAIDVLSADGTNKGVAALRRVVLGMELQVGHDLPDPG